MKIIDLDNDKIKKISEQWEAKGISSSSLKEFLVYNESNNIECKAIEQNNEVLALFEIRKAQQNCIKSMDLLISPDLGIEHDGGDIEKIFEALKQNIKIISFVFADVIKHVHAHENMCVKIYNSKDDVKTILIEFAKALKEDDDKYYIEMYRNWIEITYKK